MLIKSCVGLVMLGITTMVAQGAGEKSPIWKQSSQPIEARVESLLKELTTAEKARLCYGRSWMEAGGVKRLGIGQVKLADGPQGVTRHTEPVALPVGINLSCTWNPNSAYEYGRLIAEEMLGEKRHWILGPGVNLMRTPLCGRNFEYYGEDPFLAGKIAVDYIKGVQSLDVSACIKHLVANNQENHRYLSSSNVDERTLREIYLLPFEMAVKEGKTWSIMSAYNRLNGVYTSEHKWLQETVAKKEWGFDGVMVSDWVAAHSAKGCALGGLDLEMGSNHWGKDNALLKLVESGEVPMEVLDDKVRRMLRLMFRTHVMDPELQPKGSVQTRAHQETVRRLAAEGMVLLKNDKKTLPLNPKTVKNILVVGPNADKEHRGGGGSGGVMSPYEVTPLQGIKNVVGDRAKYVAGYKFAGRELFPTEYLKTPTGEPGLIGEYWNNIEFTGAPVVKERSLVVNMRWGNAMFGLPSVEGMPTNNLSARFSGKLIAPVTGNIKIGLGSDDGSRLWIDGKLIVDQWTRHAYTEVMSEVELVKGREYDIKIEYFDAGMDASLKLIWEDPNQTSDVAIEAAKKAETVIFVGGTHHGYDSEGGWGRNSHDIPNLELIGPQAELISKLAAVNKNVIVVLVNGSVVRMEQWIDQVPAVLEAWYGGQEAGNSIADLLFGKVNPSGKLTATFGKELNDYACHKKGTYPGKLGALKDDPHTNYTEGLFIGYRWFDQQNIEPRFPFGHGLSYTSFEVEKERVEVVNDSLVDPKVLVKVKVTNTGERKGAEVVQLYVRDEECSVVRPEKELKAFRKVFLKAGESQTVTMELNFRSFAFWCEKSKSWKVEAGDFKIVVGTSATDIKFTESIELKN